MGFNIRSLASKIDNPDSVGSTFYVVDSDYRTPAQGWTQPDGTGPLDFYNQRNLNRVFFTSGGTTTPAGATDAAAMQAAIDACIDFRGDKVYLTPGSYTPATALSIDVPGIRILGPKSGQPKSARVTVTAGIDAAYTVTAAAVDVEIGHQRIIPITAKNFFDVAAAANRGYLHHLWYDSTGIAASTSTEFLAAAASDDWLIEDCVFYTDAAQGDAFTLVSPLRWTWQRCDFVVGLSAIAWATVFTWTTSALGLAIRNCHFNTAGGATAAVYTNVITGIANLNGQVMITDCRVNGTALPTAGDIETTFGTTTDIELAENYLTGDATTQGGVLIVLT